MKAQADVNFWSWNVRLKAKGQLPDLLTKISSVVGWSMIVLQEAAWEEHKDTLLMAQGRMIYSAPAGPHARSVALAVHADWAPRVRRVRAAPRYIYVDFSFRTPQIVIHCMRVGSAHFPPSGEHHSMDEYSSLLQSWEADCSPWASAASIFGDSMPTRS